MGSTTQRIEILLIGLILLLAGLATAVVLLVRPAGPPSYDQATPRPITTAVAATPTMVDNATAAPATTAVPVVTTAIPPAPAVALVISAAPLLRSAWPWLLLGAGVVGLALVVQRRRRQLGYTNQSVGKLLAAADAETRDANVRVMRDLAARGLLTADLAAAAGIALLQPARRRRLPLPRPHLRLPHLHLPRLAHSTVRLPALRRPAVRLPRRSRPVASDAAPPPLPPALPDTGAPDAHGHDRSTPVVAPAPSAWTAEDRALAVAGALAAIWAELRLRSPVQSLDTAGAPGRGAVVVTIDQHPAEEAALAGLPERLAARRPTWRARWRRAGLVVHLPGDEAPPAGGPLVAPLLRHGRGGTMLRCFPLATWRHLGLYGASAPHALHALLSSLLYAQPPSALALAILDHGQISPLYRHVPHLVPPPGDAHATLEQLTRTLRGSPHSDARPLLLVVVEPEAAVLRALDALLARLRTQPAAPVHLLLAQERLLDAGRELYALLPALVTSGGQGAAALLPGQGGWPRPGGARLVGRGMRLDGRPLTLDEAAIAQMLDPLRGQSAALPPVLWDAPAGAVGPAQERAGRGSLAEATVRQAEPHSTEVLASESVAGAAESAGTARLRVSWERAALGPASAPAPQHSNGAVDVPAAATAPAPMVEPDNGWPPGPAPLSRVALAALLDRVVAAPAVVGGLEHERGLTKHRLVALLPELEKAQARELAERLMAWFDLAGLLVEPARPGRLRHPRPLATTDLAEIAARLAATPIPDQGTVAAMWAESHVGRA